MPVGDGWIEMRLGCYTSSDSHLECHSLISDQCRQAVPDLLVLFWTFLWHQLLGWGHYRSCTTGLGNWNWLSCIGRTLFQMPCSYAVDWLFVAYFSSMVWFSMFLSSELLSNLSHATVYCVQELWFFCHSQITDLAWHLSRELLAGIPLFRVSVTEQCARVRFPFVQPFIYDLSVQLSIHPWICLLIHLLCHLLSHSYVQCVCIASAYMGHSSLPIHLSVRP